MITPTVADGRVSVRFEPPFDLDAYQLFIATKRLPESDIAFDWRADAYTVSAPDRFARLLGVAGAREERPSLPFGGHLFDYQAAIVARALDARRFALWADTGLGKTAMFLEWARQVEVRTDGRVLIISPLQIIEQTRDECARFYLDVAARMHRITTREELIAWAAAPGRGLAIVNPEKLIAGVIPELRHLAGLVLDESSILKTGGGVIKWNLIKSARGIEYKLSCTATPAPNEVMEYASQASFLEKLRADGDILWTFFARDAHGNWRVKPHAREAFYRFMASWSIYLRDPAHYGWADILASLPDPEILEYRLDLTSEQHEHVIRVRAETGSGLFGTERMGVRERSKLSQLAKGFLYGEGKVVERVSSAKPGFVADIVRAEVAAGHKVLVWTVFDEESEILAELLAGGAFTVATLHGSMAQEARQPVIEAFRTGQTDVLVTKAALVGHGLNFQACRAMVFSGFDDSFERMYQAVRRAYRFGQTETVRVHVPYVPELEGLIFENVRAKEAAFLRDVAEAEAQYIAALERAA